MIYSARLHIILLPKRWTDERTKQTFYAKSLYILRPSLYAQTAIPTAAFGFKHGGRVFLSDGNKKQKTAVPIERKENFLQQAAFAPAVGFGQKKRAVSFDTALDFYYYLIRLWIYSKLFLAL